MARKPKLSTLRGRKPQQVRAQTTVLLILEAAAQILRSEGRAGVNTNKIAERAGVTIGTLYGYFPNKDAIFIALARQIIEEDAKELTRVLDGGHGTETIRILIRTLLKRHSDDRYVRRTVMSYYIAEGFGAEHDNQIEDMIDALIARPERLFGRKLPPIAPPRLFAASRAIIGIARALTEQSNARRFPLQTLEDEAVDLVRRYIL